MNISFSIPEVNEIRYLDDEKKPYASLEYSSLSSSIEVKDNRNNSSTLIFTSKNSPESMEDFWNELVKSSLDKKLKSLDEVINDMKEKFEIKS